MEMPDVEEFVVEDSDEDKEEGEKKLRPVIKNAVDLQRLKVEKLMKNPDKPIIIPELPKDKDFMLSVPNFVRNVMGSSAGAGSGEFHVYRHLRRKEYARQKYIQARSIREQLDNDYREKLETNKKLAEEKTAKKRAKRLKRKQKMKQKGKKPKVDDTKSQEETHSSEESNEEDSQNEEESKTDNDVNPETIVEGPTVRDDQATADKDKQESTESQETTVVGCEQVDSKKEDDTNVTTSNPDTDPAINSPKPNEKTELDEKDEVEKTDE